MPDFPIVDSHVHLYDVRRLRYGWLTGQPRLMRTHLLAEFDAACAGVAVERLVFVEVAVDPGLHLQEAAFAQSLAQADPRLCAMVAHAPVERGAAVESDLLALRQHRSLRGVRRLIETERDPSMCLEPAFIEGVRQLGRHGLTFDICLKHWGLPYAVELVRRCPDVQFVLDHIGKPAIRLGLMDPWRAQLRDLAALPNVACKLSGVITEANGARPARQQVAPYVSHAVECFGFDRLLFGSDWPVSELTHSYAEWVEIVDSIVTGSSDAERRALYRGTAARVYRLDVA